MTGGRVVPGNRWDLLDGVLPDEPPRVSVIVSHYRQPEQLARTLTALRDQDHPPQRLEIIVADDGSPEPPVVPPGVILVRQEDEGFRLAAARNLGAARATGDVLVFLDADTTPERGFVRELTRLPSLAPDCVTVGRRRHADLDGVDPGLAIAEAVTGRELEEPSWLQDAYRRSRDLKDADDRSYRYLIGAVLACSRAFFAEVGPFDEGFTRYGGEDWEWAYRAWIRGAVLAHVPQAVAWHDGPDAAGRADADPAAKDAEALRLADVIPVPGSRGHGIHPEKVDVVVVPPRDASDAESFVSVDSALAVLAGAEPAADGARFDRVRIRVEIERPVRVHGEQLADLVRRVSRERLGELVVHDSDGTILVRIVSTRAAARSRRWARDDLFRVEGVVARDLSPLRADVDLEAYLGGWG
ncbi:glycosyltransferase [Planococcus sp. APC 4015]|nr:glycosyltransferase [Planococcus sp. APC 4015]